MVTDYHIRLWATFQLRTLFLILLVKSRVVEERCGSLGDLAVSVASCTAAPSHAHLHAGKNRKRGLTEEQQTVVDDQNEKSIEKNIGQESVQDLSRSHPMMKMPKLHDSLSWVHCKSQNMSSKDSGLIITAMSSLNKFAKDGNFMRQVMRQQNDDPVVNQGLSANQLAAKALQLHLKGKHEEAEKLLSKKENIKAKLVAVDESSRPQIEENTRSMNRRQEVLTIMCGMKLSTSRNALS